MRVLTILVMLTLFLLPACASGNAEPTEETAMLSNQKMNLIIEGRTYTFTLADGTSPSSLASMLPLELEFRDFGGSEKIAYTPESISVSGGGHAPKAGDLCMYIPWGNLCFFYRDYRYSDDLVFIGRLESGTEEIASIRDNFSGRLELVD